MTELDAALSDAMLRYRIDAERLGVATARAIASDLEAAIGQIQSRIDAGGVTPRLADVRKELVAAWVELRKRIDGRVTETIEAILETAPQAVRAAVTEALYAERVKEAAGSLRKGETTPGAIKSEIVASLQPRVPVERLAQIGAAPHDGKSWQAWGSKLATDTAARIESEARQSISVGEGIPDLRKRIAKVSGLAKQSADTLARTLVSDVASRTMKATVETLFDDRVTGWRWLSTLDGRTSAMCRALDGKEWKRDEPHPLPPIHPSCRSVLVPVTALSDTLGEGGERPWNRQTETASGHVRELRRTAKARVGEARWRAMSEKDRRVEIGKERDAWNAKNSGGASNKTTYSEWFAKQPEEFQRDVLGPGRFELFKKGVPLAAMTTSDFSRPLTVAELRQKHGV